MANTFHWTVTVYREDGTQSTQFTKRDGRQIGRGYAMRAARRMSRIEGVEAADAEKWTGCIAERGPFDMVGAIIYRDGKQSEKQGDTA